MLLYKQGDIQQPTSAPLPSHNCIGKSGIASSAYMRQHRAHNVGQDALGFIYEYTLINDYHVAVLRRIKISFRGSCVVFMAPVCSTCLGTILTAHARGGALMIGLASLPLHESAVV